MKIEDGFEDVRPVIVTQTPAEQTRQTGSISGGMIFAAVGIAVLAGSLGFLGGMQVNKPSSASTNGTMPPSMNSTQQGDMMGPPTGQPQSTTGTSSSSTDNSGSTSQTGVSTN